MNTLAKLYLHAEQEINTNTRKLETQHWCVQFGEIELGVYDYAVIKEFNCDLNIMLQFLIKLYKHSLVHNDLNTAKSILLALPSFTDPYLPGILRDCGIDNSKDDYLDFIDEQLIMYDGVYRQFQIER